MTVTSELERQIAKLAARWFVYGFVVGGVLGVTAFALGMVYG